MKNCENKSDLERGLLGEEEEEEISKFILNEVTAAGTVALLFTLINLLYFMKTNDMYSILPTYLTTLTMMGVMVVKSIVSFKHGLKKGIIIV